MTIYFALLALIVSVWLLTSVFGLIARIGGSQVGAPRAGGIVMVSFGALAKIALALSYALGGFGFTPDAHASLWVGADHLSNAVLMIGAGMMVRGGFRTSDQARKPTAPPTPTPARAQRPRPSSGGELARVRN